MSVYDVDGQELSVDSQKQTLDVLVASSQADSKIKGSADYVCTGIHDEIILQQAISYVANNGGGVVRLSEGRFYIDSFPYADSGDDNVAILLPQSENGYNIEIIGSAYPYGSVRGTRISVTQSCYSGISDSQKYTVMRAGYVASLMRTPSKVSLYLKDLSIILPNNQKQIMCLDLLYVNRVLVERVSFRAEPSDGTNPVAVENCIGMRSVGGSNNGILADYRNILARGFYEGFQMGGEHVIGINLSAIHNVYGFTFGNYPWSNIMAHPITLINCCDERGVNMPLFGKNGATTEYGPPSFSPKTIGYQAVTLIDFNMERAASETPGGVLGNNATELEPGTWRGSIEYSITNPWYPNAVNVKFWADGSGNGIVSRNQAHLRSGPSTLRRSYAPTYLQQFYDTTVNKLLICTDTATPTWVDSSGNVVS